MTAHELLQLCRESPERYQLAINAFIDEWRAASMDERARLAGDGFLECGRTEGLVAAVVSALCRESGLAAPDWLRVVGSPEPYFVIPARGMALRLRLMLDSPAPFFVRNVFVPKNYLSRA